MRTIDADELIKAIIRKEPFSDCARVVIAECMAEVRHAPTIEPERKKGRWIDKDGGIATCSVCGDRWGVYSVMNYCPNCGAYMREEGE